MHIGRLSTAIVVVALCLSACGQTKDDKASEAAASGKGGTDASAGTGSTGSGNLWNGGNAKPLDIQVAHPNGTVLQLTSLKTQTSSTAIGLRAINGKDRDVEINRWNNRQGYILLDNGEKLYLSPPTSNPRLSIPAGQTFEGELVFLGRMPPVRSAVLVLNENSQTDNEYTNTPGFRIDLPLDGPAAGATK